MSYEYKVLDKSQIRLLDRYVDSLSKVKLSELLDNALSLVAGEIPDGSITASKVAADAITTAKILNGAVTAAKLATAIQPSHVVKFAGSFTTVGGDTSEIIPVSGVLATDIVIATIKVAGAVPVVLQATASSADAIELTFSADPAADHVISYVVYRAIV